MAEDKMEVAKGKTPATPESEEVVYKLLREVDFKEVARFLDWDESQVRHYSNREASREGAVDKDHVELHSPNGLYVNIGLDDQEVYVNSTREKPSFHLGHLKVDKVALKTGAEHRREFKRLELVGEDNITIDHDSLVRAIVNGRQTVWAP